MSRGAFQVSFSSRGSCGPASGAPAIPHGDGDGAILFPAIPAPAIPAPAIPAPATRVPSGGPLAPSVPEQPPHSRAPTDPNPVPTSANSTAEGSESRAASCGRSSKFASLTSFDAADKQGANQGRTRKYKHVLLRKVARRGDGSGMLDWRSQFSRSLPNESCSRRTWRRVGHAR